MTTVMIKATTTGEQMVVDLKTGACSGWLASTEWGYPLDQYELNEQLEDAELEEVRKADTVPSQVPWVVVRK